MMEEQSGIGKLFFIILLNISYGWPKAIISVGLALETNMVCET